MRHRNYLLAVLFVVLVFNTIDIAALGLVSQEIKLELSLTDTQLGVLTGIAFALFYSFVGIVIARWADRGDRVAIISLAAVVWSVLVAACGTAANFGQLLLLRIGVGMGEAGCVPASQSLIADHFDRAERARANAIYFMGGSVGSVVGFALAGWLNELYGWRVMFMVLGLPGIFIAALAWFTLREPRFERSDNCAGGARFTLSRSLLKTAARRSPPPRLKETANTLWSNRTLRHLLLFWSVWSFFVAALWQWLPVFFERSHGLSTGKLGVWFAVVYGSGGAAGAILGGTWASRYAANNERLQLRIAVAFSSGLTILSALIYLAPNPYVAFGLLGLYTVVTNAFSGPLMAMFQTLVPENVRSTATAILALLSNLIGNGLGSLATGALSDTLRGHFGEESLRYALLTLCAGFLWAAWHLWQASKSVTGDLAATEDAHDETTNDALVVRTSPNVSF